MYARICPDCGCYLDPAERCDCKDEREKEKNIAKKKADELLKVMLLEESGQYRFAI